MQGMPEQEDGEHRIQGRNLQRRHDRLGTRGHYVMKWCTLCGILGSQYGIVDGDKTASHKEEV